MKGGENVTDIELLFNNYYIFIFKYLLKLSKNISVAEELTQETFFKAYINISKLKNEEKASIWLYSIARNTYFAWYNKNQKTESLNNTEELTAGVFDTEETVIKKIQTEDALNFLNELKEPYKEVFWLVVEENMQLKDISAIFGKSESWARVTFYRAKQKISEKNEGKL